jgi:hypothetical protein
MMVLKHVLVGVCIAERVAADGHKAFQRRE